MLAQKISRSIAVFMFVVLSLSLVSALSLTNPIDFTQSKNSSNLILTNNDAVEQNVTLSINSIVTSSGQVSFEASPSTISNLDPSDTRAITLKVSEVSGNLEFGRHTASLIATGVNPQSGALVSTRNVSVTFLQSFCNAGEVGDLRIKNIDINSK
jgi:hypothetical protein